MTSLLKAEWIQLRTTRTAIWWGSILLFLAILLPAAMLIYTPTRISFNDVLHMRGLDFLVYIFCVVAVSGNYRHKVSVTEQLITPSIWQSMLAKLIVFGAFGAFVVIAQISFLSGLIAIWPGASLSGNLSELKMVGVVTLGGALWAMLGVAFARLIRVQVAAVLAAIGYFLIEPAIISTLQWFKPALHDMLAPFFAGQAFRNLMGVGEGSSLVAGFVLVAWIAVISMFAYLLDRKRD